MKHIERYVSFESMLNQLISCILPPTTSSNDQKAGMLQNLGIRKNCYLIYCWLAVVHVKDKDCPSKGKPEWCCALLFNKVGTNSVTHLETARRSDKSQPFRKALAFYSFRFGLSENGIAVQVTFKNVSEG